VVERLLPVISRPQLKSIGIGKAVELGKIEKKTGLVPDSQIIELALKPETTVEALKEAIHDRYKTGKEEAGKYYEFGGFRVNPDEEAEITYGLELVTKQAGLENLPTNIQRKEQFLALVREFVGTYGGANE
jgi:hypothetical protein